MTPARRAKIKALAEDARGNPATRAIAQRMLKRYPEPPKPPRQQRVSGVERSPEYLQFIFMDLNRWKPYGKKGQGLSHITSYGGIAYKFVLYKFSQPIGAVWGWKRTSGKDVKVSHTLFETRTEAHKDAWKSLQTI